MGKYDDIMQHLNPRVVIEKTQVPHDNARANCTMQSSTISSYREFESIVIAYVAHHMQEVFGSPPPPEFCLDKARKFLESSIGFDNAVFLGMSGSEGGMFNVLNQICEGFKKEAKEAYFSYIIDTYIDPLSFQDTVEVMRELKEKIGAYSPQSFGYVEPEAMAVHYKDILWNYIDSLSRYRNLWAY